MKGSLLGTVVWSLWKLLTFSSSVYSVFLLAKISQCQDKREEAPSIMDNTQQFGKKTVSFSCRQWPSSDHVYDKWWVDMHVCVVHLGVLWGLERGRSITF